MEAKFQKAVVLVVDKYSQDAHLANLTAGVKYPVIFKGSNEIEYTRGFYSILADLANVQPGVSVFFYRRRIDEPPEGRGFIGEWEVSADSYEDLTTEMTYGNLKIFGRCPYCGCPISILVDKKPRCESCEAELQGHILPLRFPINLTREYSRYLDDNTAYTDITDEGRLSTLIFRKIYGAGRERSVNPILPEEAVKLRRLLQRVETAEKNHRVHFPSPNLYHPLTTAQSLDSYINFAQEYPLKDKGNTLLYDPKSDELAYETILEFWILRQLVRNPTQILSDLGFPPKTQEQLEWFANQVLFGIGGEKSDILLLLRNSLGKRCRAIVIELKKGTIDAQSFQQVKSYAYWVAQLVTAQVQDAIQHPFVITPIAVGHRIQRGLQPFESFRFQIPYATPLTVVVEQPRALIYSVQNAEIILHPTETA
ncbi:MAG: hypothetical protein ACUVV1_04390 [Fimbriimonadales bacterium]